MPESKPKFQNLIIEKREDGYLVTLVRKITKGGYLFFIAFYLFLLGILVYSLCHVLFKNESILNEAVKMIFSLGFMAIFCPILFRSLGGNDALALSTDRLEIRKNLLGLALKKSYNAHGLRNFRLSEDKDSLLFESENKSVKIDLGVLSHPAAKAVAELLASYYHAAPARSESPAAPGALRMVVTEDSGVVRVTIHKAGSSLRDVVFPMIFATVMGLAVWGSYLKYGGLGPLFGVAFCAFGDLFIFLSLFTREILAISEKGMTRRLGPWGLGLTRHYALEKIEMIRPTEDRCGLEMDYRGKRKMVEFGESLEGGETDRLLKLISDRNPELLKAKPRFSVNPLQQGVQILIRGREWVNTAGRGINLEKFEEDEELTIANAEWSLGPKGNPGRQKGYDPTLIQNLRLASRPKVENISRKLKGGSYGLVFDYKSQPVQFARGLSPEEAKPLLEEIKKHLPM